MNHRLDLVDSTSLHTIVLQKVRDGEWELDDTFEAYRGNTCCFSKPLSVSYHYGHYVCEGSDGRRMGYKKVSK